MVRSGKSARQTRVLGRGIVARQSDGDLCADASAQPRRIRVLWCPFAVFPV